MSGRKDFENPSAGEIRHRDIGYMLFLASMWDKVHSKHILKIASHDFGQLYIQYK
jgi:hypothetical protein